ncbi:MAG TPA: sensor histidine kinase [Clostridia bacterium]|nr:sensor histidine kinase [Clostridia bacterium]
MNPNTGTLLLRYIRSKLKSIGLFLLCMLVFFAICLLYQLENIPKLLYAFFLWTFIGLCYGAGDFIRFVKKTRALHTALINIENMHYILPSPDGAIERQYRELLDFMLDERRRLLSRTNIRDADMDDYYTMWAHQIKVPIAAMRLLLQNAESHAAESGAGRDTEIPDTEANDKAGRPETGDTKPYVTATRYNRLLSEELFRIEQYVEMVLYYQRLDSINSDFLFKEYDLRDIVNQTVRKHSMFFINSRLSLDMEDFSCKVVTDEKWLQFVIGQVLSNALKYTQRGSIAIRLEKAQASSTEKAQEVDRENYPESALKPAPTAPKTALKNTFENAPGLARLIIEDTGIGIRPEDLPRVFERGFTGYNGRLDKKSTGIGLYLSKKILEKLSHTIEVASEAGKGTCVTIGFVLTKM